jgi:hypothetical protein
LGAAYVFSALRLLLLLVLSASGAFAFTDCTRCKRARACIQCAPAGLRCFECAHQGRTRVCNACFSNRLRISPVELDIGI